MVALFFSTRTFSLLHWLPCVAALLPALNSSFPREREEMSEDGEE